MSRIFDHDLFTFQNEIVGDLRSLRTFLSFVGCFNAKNEENWGELALFTKRLRNISNGFQLKVKQTPKELNKNFKKLARKYPS